MLMGNLIINAIQVSMFPIYMLTDYCSVQDWEQGTSANTRSPFGASKDFIRKSGQSCVCVFPMYNLAIHLGSIA